MISSWASSWPQIRVLAERNPREISIANVPDVLLPTSVLGCFYSTNADDTTLMAESKEELKSLPMKLNEEREKAGVFPTLTHYLIQSPCRSNWRTPALTHLSVTSHEAGHRGVWPSVGRPWVPFLPAASPPSTFEHFQTQHSTNEDHGIWSHHVMANRWGNNGNSDRLYFLGLQNHPGWGWQGVG